MNNPLHEIRATCEALTNTQGFAGDMAREILNQLNRFDGMTLPEIEDMILCERFEKFGGCIQRVARSLGRERTTVYRNLPREMKATKMNRPRAGKIIKPMR